MASARTLAAHPGRDAVAWTTRAQEALPGVLVAGVVGFLAAFGWLCVETIGNGKALAALHARMDAQEKTLMRIEAKLDALAKHAGP